MDDARADEGAAELTGPMMGGMWVVMLLGAVVVAALIGFAIYLGVRATQPRARAESAQDALERRLAAGEITPEDFFERESALRSAGPARSHRRW